MLASGLRDRGARTGHGPASSWSGWSTRAVREDGMATDVKEPPRTGQAPADAPSANGTSAGKGGLLKVGGLVIAVMLVQGVATWFLLPPAPAVLPEGSEVEEPADSGGVEVALDKITPTNTTATGHPIHVSAEVVAIVSASQQVQFDQVANKDLKARVRQVCRKVLESANMAELNEPGNGTIRRRMREEINKLLRKSYVIDVVFPHFQKQEQ
jgi:flagellar basal body-associated protein FliL